MSETSNEENSLFSIKQTLPECIVVSVTWLFKSFVGVWFFCMWRFYLALVSVFLFSIAHTTDPDLFCLPVLSCYDAFSLSLNTMGENFSVLHIDSTSHTLIQG